MNLSKKIISLSLVAILGIQNLQAAAFVDDILSNSLMNVTPAGKIVDKDASGRVKSTNFYTSSVYFKFGGSYSYPEPLFSVTPPQMAMGCGGLSIKGMFGSLIGLDRFEQMLKNAGASLAWGIAVGLVYSLPGIGTAFRMLNEWAKKIQQLMANACQSGMNIGEAIRKNSPGLKDNALFNSLARAPEAATKQMDQAMATKFEEFGIAKYFDNNMVFKVDSDNTPAPKNIAESWAQFLIGGTVRYSMRTNVLSALLDTSDSISFNNFIAMLYGGQTIKDFQDINFAISYNNTSFDSASGDGSPIVSILNLLAIYGSTIALNKQNTIAQTFMSAAIASYVSSDITLTEPSSIENDLSDIRIALDSNSSVADAEKGGKKLSDLISGNSSFTGFTLDQSSVGSNIDSFAKGLVNYLYYGNESGYIPENAKDLNSTISKAIGVPNEKSIFFGMPALEYKAIAFPDPANASSANKVFVFIPIAKTINATWFAYRNSDSGSLGRSIKLINDIINNGANAQVSEISSGMVLLVPGIIQKIKVIQQSPLDMRPALINTLAQYNAYQFVKGAISAYFDNGTLHKTSIPVYNSNGTKFKGKLVIPPIASDMFMAMLPTVQTKMSELQDKTNFYLRQAYGLEKSIPDAYALEKVFEEQDKRNIANATKSINLK